MSYIKIRFGTGFDKAGDHQGKSMEDMFSSIRPMFSIARRNWKPQMDIYETPDEILILAEIAGVDKEQLEVEISAKAIRISGCRDGGPPIPNATYRLAEVLYGSFERVLYLPSPIDTERVSASYNNGFLQVRMAKLHGGGVHKVEIQTD